MPFTQQDYERINAVEEWPVSEEVHDIITKVPSWILRRGISLILVILMLILGMAALINYPDVVRTTLKINSLNSPKAVISHQNGKLIRLLVADNEKVVGGQALAYIESTADHEDIFRLLVQLRSLREKLLADNGLSLQHIHQNKLKLGELQNSYETFYQEFLDYTNAQDGGYYLKQRDFLKKNLSDIKRLRAQIIEQREIQLKEFANAEEEYKVYQKLQRDNVISRNEFKQRENRYLASKYPLQQSSTELLNNNSLYIAKNQEVIELENVIRQQEAKFRQSLNSMIIAAETWSNNYVVTAPFKGTVNYSGILQENQNVTMSQELFVLDPGNTDFFGELQVPQYNMGKIEVGQRALIKMRSYPFEEYGLIYGKISYIADVALKDSVFMAKVNLEKFEGVRNSNKIVLKQGMLADVEIITKESSLLKRFFNSITRIFNKEN